LNHPADRLGPAQPRHNGHIARVPTHAKPDQPPNLAEPMRTKCPPLYRCLVILCTSGPYLTRVQLLIIN
jgi:hypothetical protein